MDKNYDLALALIRFRTAWKDLTDISVNVNIDMSDGYPFYLLNFEDITPQVIQWCNIHASRLIQEAPDRIVNPSCLRCEYVFAGFANDGRCIGQKAGIDCKSYPEIPYSREMILSAMSTPSSAADMAKLTDDNLLMLYVDYINTKRKEDGYEHGSNEGRS